MNNSPTIEEIETGLTHINYKTRRKWAQSDLYIPTRSQFERGLQDIYISVREIWIERIIPGVIPTIDEVERGLTDRNSDIRIAWLKRKDYVLTSEQVERVLHDPHHYVLQLVAERDDITLSQDQMKVGLSHENLATFRSFVCRPETRLNHIQMERLQNMSSVFFEDRGVEKSAVIRQIIARMALPEPADDEVPLSRKMRL